jgi:hypothetical protein
VPNLISYDPTFAYEIAVILEDGIRRMYKDGESVFYYLTVMNETYEMLPMPEGSRDGILKGLYKLRTSSKKKAKGRAQLIGRRRHPQRGAQGAADAREGLRCGRRRVERAELPGALSRRPRLRALEPAAPGERRRCPTSRSASRRPRASSWWRRTT